LIFVRLVDVTNGVKGFIRRIARRRTYGASPQRGPRSNSPLDELMTPPDVYEKGSIHFALEAIGAMREFDLSALESVEPPRA
jgi:hypothetical protein